MKREKKDYRLRIVKSNGPIQRPEVTYIYRKKGAVHFVSGTETPLALSNLLHERAAETRFALEDVMTAVEAARVLIKTLSDMYQHAMGNCPRVEVLS